LVELKRFLKKKIEKQKVTTEKKKSSRRRLSVDGYLLGGNFMTKTRRGREPYCVYDCNQGFQILFKPVLG